MEMERDAEAGWCLFCHDFYIWLYATLSFLLDKRSQV